MAALSPRAPGQIHMLSPITTHIRVEDIRLSYEDYPYRIPLKFHGIVVDRVTLLNVTCIVRTRAGHTATGFGSMPLGNTWAFPSQRMSYGTTLGAMKSLAERISRITAGYREYGHPIEINQTLEPDYIRAAGEVSAALKLVEPIPKLAALVTASPFDAALHDAFGRAHGLSCYYTYGPPFLTRDLGEFLGSEFRDETLGRYILREPVPRLPLYHLVGALDAITDSDLGKRLDDGLPETLPEWIRFNGLTTSRSSSPAKTSPGTSSA